MSNEETDQMRLKTVSNVFMTAKSLAFRLKSCITWQRLIKHSLSMKPALLFSVVYNISIAMDGPGKLFISMSQAD